MLRHGLITPQPYPGATNLPAPTHTDNNSCAKWAWSWHVIGSTCQPTICQESATTWQTQGHAPRRAHNQHRSGRHFPIHGLDDKCPSTYATATATTHQSPARRVGPSLPTKLHDHLVNMVQLVPLQQLFGQAPPSGRTSVAPALRVCLLPVQPPHHTQQRRIDPLQDQRSQLVSSGLFRLHCQPVPTSSHRPWRHGSHSGPSQPVCANQPSHPPVILPLHHSGH